MIKKDPTFEKTRRKFDQTGLDTMFLNTLQMSDGYSLKIYDKIHKCEAPRIEEECEKSVTNNQTEM